MCFVRVMILLLGSVSVDALLAQNGSEPVSLSFQNATIRPSKLSEVDERMQIQPHRWIARTATVYELMMYAFDGQRPQFVGVPKWADEDRWDIDAIPESETQPTREQFHAMLRALLIERFGLSLTASTRVLPVYALRIDKAGLRISRSDAPASVTPRWEYKGEGYLVAHDVYLAGLAHNLQWDTLDRPLVDQTGLIGRFSGELHWRSDSLATEPSDYPDLFAAVREQLGLRLERTNAPVIVWIVNHLTLPTPK